MLSKIIKLEDIYDDYKNPSIPGDGYITRQFMQFTIEAFKTLTDYTKGICEIQKDIIIGMDKLEKRIKKLEQQDSYYPATQEEINNIKEVRNLNG